MDAEGKILSESLPLLQGISAIADRWVSTFERSAISRINDPTEIILGNLGSVLQGATIPLSAPDDLI